MRKILMIVAATLLSLLPGSARDSRIISIETDNNSLVLAVREDGSVYQLHYGARVSSSEFAAVPIRDGRYSAGSLAYPAAGGRFLDQPALHLQYADGTHNTELRYVSHGTVSTQGVLTTTVNLQDEIRKITVRLIYEAYPEEDVIVEHAEIVNGGTAPVTMLDYASSAISFRADSYLLSHVHGGWAKEMQLEHEQLGFGTKVIESRRGAQNTQCANPSFLLSLGTGELRENAGEVVAGALAWSGNYELRFDRTVDGRLTVLAGINPFSSAYPLAAGQTFRTPGMIWTWSQEGAGRASRNLHRWARRHALHSGGQMAPILLNSWEGAYFNFTADTILRMIDDAASMGLEMFVLDDGWFGNNHPRNSDAAGLGDWQVNRRKLPKGIGHLASYAHSKGLKFGIWIEPEMVNPKSDLARKHPEWVVGSRDRELYETRNQWILDLSNPAVQDFVFGVFDDVMKLSPDIDYVKWDCNREVLSFWSSYLGDEQDRFYVEYYQGLYSVMDRIRAKYPDVMIQCCSSGGGRVEYGELSWFDEIWTSDDTDAMERIAMQYATSLIYPACIMGSHVSTVPNHQTHAVTPLKFRFDVACQGRLGLELQPRLLSEEELALVRRCVGSYKTYRDIIETGDLYRLGSPLDSDFYGMMYVTPDRSRAVVFTYCLEFDTLGGEGHPFRLEGLDPGRKYKVTEQNVDRSCWWGDGASFTGAFLSSGAFAPSLPARYSSAVFVLEAQ
ncbi:MAG: alpha-galactosidase [Bacteroidales bacterium]|nr:alpha-galactosidase [Bacteroidales bacterium]